MRPETEVRLSHHVGAADMGLEAKIKNDADLAKKLPP